MTAIILERAREALALGEVNEATQLQGHFQGRKVIPLPFYLLVGGAILGGIAAIALTIAALALPLFVLYIAAAACALLCLTNALAAFTIYKLVPETTLSSVVDALSVKVKNLFQRNHNLNVELPKDPLLNAQVPKIKLQKQEPAIAQLNHQNEDQKKQLAIFKRNLLEYVKNQEDITEASQKLLEDFILFVEERGEDTSSIEEMKEIFENIELNDNFADAKELLDQQIRKNQALQNQYAELLKILKNYIERQEQVEDQSETKENLEAQIRSLTEAKAELEKWKEDHSKDFKKIQEVLKDDEHGSLMKVRAVTEK